MGARVRIEGRPLPRDVFFIANHVSWLDILVLGGATGAAFISHDGVAGWPFVGWLATRGETIYHERGSSESMGGVLHEMLARLRAGRSVGVFPEGRTRDGRPQVKYNAAAARSSGGVCSRWFRR